MLDGLASRQKTLVEIGVYEGVASCVIRRAMSPDAQLVLIDPYPSGRIGISVAELIAHRELRRIANGAVVFDRRFSFDVAVEWSESIDLLFYDAHNDYSGVKRDFEAWSRFLSSDGLYLLHTSRTSIAKPVSPTCGTVRFANEIEALYPEFEIVGTLDSISVISRRSISSVRRQQVVKLCTP